MCTAKCLIIFVFVCIQMWKTEAALGMTFTFIVPFIIFMKKCRLSIIIKILNTCVVQNFVSFIYKVNDFLNSLN